MYLVFFPSFNSLNSFIFHIDTTMTQSSGVQAHSDCIKEFNELKLGKKTKYIIFRLNNDNTEIVVEKTSTSEEYEDFLKDLPEDQCRWAVYDLEFKKAGEGTRQKIVLCSWAPDAANIKAKMVFASSKDALRLSLGIATEIQASDYDEVAYQVVLEKAFPRSLISL